MAQNKKSIVENLDHLLILLSILKEKNYLSYTIKLDRNIISSLQEIVESYHELSIEISDEVLFKFSEPLDHIVRDLIEQIGMVLNDIPDEPDSLDELKEDISEIDFLLKDPLLSVDEINDLLDRRSDILEILKNID